MTKPPFNFEDELEACIQMARDAGCPTDQVEYFLNKGYVPLPWQWRLHAVAREADKKNGPVLIGAGGARGPGKSHGIFSQITLDDMARVPRLKALFLRQTGKAAKESFEDLVERVLGGKTPYQYSSGVLRLPNGSRAILGGFKDEKDIDKYIGIEYDVMGVEEINQLTETKVTKLRGSLRTSKDNWRPRMYASFNPGGKGHGYVKKAFIDPFRQDMEEETRFVPALYSDNPYLNDEYIDYLFSLEGELGKAWREGNFDIAAGQFFTSWDYNLHVVEPRSIPDEWKHFIMLDYGFTAPAAVYWGAVDPFGTLWLYRELYITGMTYEDLMTEIVRKTPPNEVPLISYMVADPAIWGKTGTNVLTGAQIFEQTWKNLTKQTLRLVPGDNDRVQGWDTMRGYLKPRMLPDKSVRPKLQIFSTCPELIRTLPEMVYDEHNIEDLDTDLEDHGVDAVRYGVRTEPKPARTTEEVANRHFRMKMQAKKNRTDRAQPRRGFRII